MTLVGLAKDDHACTGSGVKERFHAGDGDGLMLGGVLALRVAGGEDHQDTGDEACGYGGAEEDLRVLDELSFEHVEGADCGHDEGGGDDGGAHVVRVLEDGPGVHQQSPEAGDLEGAVGQDLVGDGVLHPGVGDDDEVAGEPGAEEDHEGRSPVSPGGETLFGEEEEAKEAGLEEEGEDAFHGERLADDSAGDAGEGGPVGAELKLHGDAGDDADDEVDGEDLSPKAGCVLIEGIFGTYRHRFQDDDEQREAHSELRKEIMEGERKAEMNPMHDKWIQDIPPAVLKIADAVVILCVLR